MVWCVGEIYLFQVYAKSDVEKRATKGIISNLLNRLIIMLDEEMLFAECEKYLLVRRYMEDFEKSNRGDFKCLFKRLLTSDHLSLKVFFIILKPPTDITS